MEFPHLILHREFPSVGPSQFYLVDLKSSISRALHKARKAHLIHEELPSLCLAVPKLVGSVATELKKIK